MLLERAEPFYRPNGDPHPDIFRIKGTKGSTIVRGEVILKTKDSIRTPDITTDQWQSQGNMRQTWIKNWKVHGDSRHDADARPIPARWSSFCGLPLPETAAVVAQLDPKGPGKEHICFSVAIKGKYAT